MIAAIDQSNGLGKNGNLLCRIPRDMRFFKETTMNHVIIMGRKTFESLKSKPLPGRKNVVVSGTREPVLGDDLSIVGSLYSALAMRSPQEEVFVIGGEQLFSQAMPLASKLYLTKIEHKFDGADVFFPEIDLSEWEMQSETIHKADSESPYDLKFQTWIKK